MSTQTRHPFYWVPNFMTLSRIAVIPVLMWCILAVGRSAESLMNTPVLLILLFIYCGITDFLDGFLARRWNLVSNFGRMLDPIADKLLVAGCLIALNIAFGPNPILLIPSIIIIFRDIFISGTREHAAGAGIILPPTKLAKWKTSTEILAILLFLVGIGIKSLHSADANLQKLAVFGNTGGLAVLWIAALLSAYTGLHYVKAAFAKT